MLDKEQTLHSFWSAYGLPAYDENTVPDDAQLPYITYNVATASLGEPVELSASIWYKSTSWAEITAKAQQISQDIGMGGKVIKFAGGYVWMVRGIPFSQRLPDEDDTIRRIYITVQAEYLCEN